MEELFTYLFTLMISSVLYLQFKKLIDMYYKKNYLSLEKYNKRLQELELKNLNTRLELLENMKEGLFVSVIEEMERSHKNFIHELEVKELSEAVDNQVKFYGKVKEENKVNLDFDGNVINKVENDEVKIIRPADKVMNKEFKNVKKIKKIKSTKKIKKEVKNEIKEKSEKLVDFFKRKTKEKKTQY